MSIFPFSFKSTAEESGSELSEIFPLSLTSEDFVKTDVLNTYLKILTDTVERTHGVPLKQQSLLWDNCVQNEATEGLITLLARAMADKSDLFLVFKPSVNVLRKATAEEERVIRADYKANGESKNGVYISFKNYKRSDMLKIYSTFEYSVLASLHKTVNIAKAVQIKINDLRSAVALADSEIAKAQARSIAKALGDGKDILLDVKDEVTTAQIDTAPTEKAIGFLDAKRAFILALPMSYLSGIQTGGIGSTGEADMRAVERGLKQYYVSIVRPAIRALFGAETEFKTQDFRQMTTALEALKTFDLVSDDNLSREAKKELLARMFDLDPEAEKKNLEADAKENAKNAADEKNAKPLGRFAFGKDPKSDEGRA